MRLKVYFCMPDLHQLRMFDDYVDAAAIHYDWDVGLTSTSAVGPTHSRQAQRGP